MNRKKKRVEKTDTQPPTNRTKETPTRLLYSVGQSLDSMLCCKIQTMLPTKMENQNKNSTLQEHV